MTINNYSRNFFWQNLVHDLPGRTDYIFFAKIGFKTKQPKWLLSGWAISIFYIFILVYGINILAIHRNPAYMASYLTFIIVVSIVIGIIYEKNTFCRYVCPVGHLLGIYSRISMWGWRVKNPTICTDCSDKSCIQKKYRYSLNNKSCGVNLYPAKIEDNSHCILCAGCLKTCNNYQNKNTYGRPNPGFIKVGFSNGLLNAKPMIVAEWFFLFIVSGFVIYEIFSEFNSAKSVLLFLPNFINTTLLISNAAVKSLLKSIYLFFFLPAIFWFLPFLIIKISKETLSIKDYVLYYGLVFIPIVAAAHLSKAILKTTSRIPYFKYIINDYKGIETAKAIVAKNISLQAIPLWSEWIITIAITTILLIGYYIGLKMIDKIDNKLLSTKGGIIMKLPVTLYFLLFFIEVIIWRWF